MGSNGLPSRAFTSVGFAGVGNGGSINITAGSLFLTNGAFLNASNRGQGDGGSVNIVARDTVAFDGVGPNGVSSGAFTSVETTGVGNGGNINITAGLLSLINGAFLNAKTRGQGNGGNVNISARDTVSFDGVGSNRLPSRAFTSVETTGVGNGGSINITAESLSLKNGAQLSTSNEGTGNAGNLEVAARSMRLSNQGKLTAETASGDGGNIRLQVQDLLLMRHNSLISAEAHGTGIDGNVDIDADLIVAVPSENSDIISNAFGGSGGNIGITAQGIFGTEIRKDLTEQSDIVAVGKNRSFIPVEMQVVEPLPSAELVDVTGLITTGCAAVGENRFIITGRGGIPPSPTDTAVTQFGLICALLRRS